MSEVTLHPPGLDELGVAASIVGIMLFALLAVLTASPATAVTGCGSAALLLIVSLVAGRCG